MVAEDTSEMIADIIAIVSIWKIVKEERRELQSIKGINDCSIKISD
jgi:hypothetical protein